MSFPSAFTKSSSSTPATWTLVPSVVALRCRPAVVGAASGVRRDARVGPQRLARPAKNPRVRTEALAAHVLGADLTEVTDQGVAVWRRSTPCSPASPSSGSTGCGPSDASSRSTAAGRRPGLQAGRGLGFESRCTSSSPPSSATSADRHDRRTRRNRRVRRRSAGGLDGRRRDRVAARRAAGPRRPRAPDRRRHRMVAGSM